MNENENYSKSEVGHLKNVANLKKLITKIESFPDYDPVNPLIFIVDLRKKHLECDLLVRDAIKKRSDYNHIVNERQEPI